jgi:hypothetical protein
MLLFLRYDAFYIAQCEVAPWFRADASRYRVAEDVDPDPVKILGRFSKFGRCGAPTYAVFIHKENVVFPGWAGTD